MEEVKQDIEIHFRGTPDVATFENIIGYQLGSGFLGVMADTRTFIYPSDTIEYVVVEVKE